MQSGAKEDQRRRHAQAAAAAADRLISSMANGSSAPTTKRRDQDGDPARAGSASETRPPSSGRSPYQATTKVMNSR